MSAPAREEVGAQPVGGRRVALLAVCTALVVAPYLAGVLVPYHVNDLDAVPLAEVAGGAHDPKDLWPHGTAGGLAQLAGMLSLALTPIGLVAVLVAALDGLFRRRPTPVVALGLASVALACLAGWAFFLSPLGTALISWRMD
ncbi:hypothetical protein GCM10023328_38880 [Modestobacter marinus]|uniref:Uncharacterized protein n=1 Tax=Modestobacter marinus TaxID=477641 RepID=A0A846LXG0_9ACTN|nr:hypothetical protein [Modestobacter marinus]NIH70178.1 hypothetical protein [Modestobacter marinus]GGL76367.1 hypothetical protein GCM10011589_35570 [Modestobacter marinus]